MSPVIIETTMPLVTKLIVLCLLLYLPVLFFTRVARRGRAPLASAVVPLTLTPLLLGAMAAGWTLVKLSRLVPLTGGSASRAAGLAEALALLVFGAVIAAIVGAAALVSAYRTGNPFRASAICFCASVAIVVAGCIAVKHFTTIAIGPPPQGRVRRPALRVSLRA